MKRTLKANLEDPPLIVSKQPTATGVFASSKAHHRIRGDIIYGYSGMLVLPFHC